MLYDNYVPRLKHPSIKQKNFVKAYLKTGRKDLAVLESHTYQNKKYASTYGQRVFKQKGTQEYLQKCLESSKLTEERIAEGLDNLLLKSKPSKRVSDPRLHLLALKEVAKLRDLYPAEKRQIEQKTARLNIDLKGKNENELMEELSKIGNQINDFKRLLKNDRIL